MESTIRFENKVGVITLSGRFDSGAAPLFDAWFAQQDKPEISRYLLDLAEVPYITSAGLRSLLKLLKLLEGRGGRLILCCVAAPVQDLFKIAGFSGFLTICETRETALGALAG
ncbi:MAG: STAS domain-containing protein [Trichlorobacter sp.]|uniref:STAS domain-containing protein n=1 Tax=Trichlorobacter sp. TaxID=2911007 RepID=UPI00256A06F2|nr:STAS domain-containing protein [Trichlorobacter sp.]MDK9718369.1 STAS domain-containing protein [Trichlorobacter sp.]